MASNTKQTEFRRVIRWRKAGKENKRKRVNQGTTPAFSVHTPEADKNAPNQAKQSDG